MMKYYSSLLSREEYFRNDSMIDLVIFSRQRISDPSLLRTILQMVQLTAFLTYISESKSKSLIPEYVSLLILERPWGDDSNKPNKRVAYLRILMTLQWVKAEAKPTHPWSIILPRWKCCYFFQSHHWQFNSMWWMHWYIGLLVGLQLIRFQSALGWLDQKQLYKLQCYHTEPWREALGRGAFWLVVMKRYAIDKTASVIYIYYPNSTLFIIPNSTLYHIYY